MRNIFETVVANQANRLVEKNVITTEKFCEICVDDFPPIVLL